MFGVVTAIAGWNGIGRNLNLFSEDWFVVLLAGPFFEKTKACLNNGFVFADSVSTCFKVRVAQRNTSNFEAAFQFAKNLN